MHFSQLQLSLDNFSYESSLRSYTNLTIEGLITSPIGGSFFFFLVNRKYLINDEKYEYESQQINQNATPQAHAQEVCKIK